MAARKVPSAQEILAAAEAAKQQAQEVAGAAFETAVRLPPASAQLALQMPDLIEHLATSIERLNTAIDRLDRVLALVDPLFVALDQLLPRIEALAELGDDVGRVVGRLPGMGTLGRLTWRAPGEESEPEQTKKRKPTAKNHHRVVSRRPPIGLPGGQCAEGAVMAGRERRDGGGRCRGCARRGG